MKYFNSKVKIGQVITKEEIANWEGDVIFNIGTGGGKTYFVLNNLSQYCKENNKRILFICNRKVLAEEVNRNITKNNIDNVDVITYQSIENKLKNKKEVVLDYDFICADEFHHVLESSYNFYSDLSFNFITNHPSQKIYMSATCDKLFEGFVQNRKVSEEQYYYIEKDYSYLTKIYFYNKNSDHESIIKEKLKNKDEKIMFFTQSLNRAKEVYLEHRNIATFFCSSYTKDSMSKKFLKECQGDIQNEQFNKRLLVSTSAFDVGANIIDYNVKTIVLDMFNYATLIQCLGRKRILSESDNCEVYIRNYHRGELNIKHNQYFKAVDMFIHNEEEFHRTYGIERDYNNPYIFHDKESDTWTVNTLAYFSMKQEEQDLFIMKNQCWVDENFEQHIGIGYKNFILDKMKISRDDERVRNYDEVKDVAHMYDLNEYLESMVGRVMLTPKDRVELIERIDIRNGNNNRLIKNRIALNIALEEGNYKYTIHEFETSHILDGKKKRFKRAWTVLKVGTNCIN